MREEISMCGFGPAIVMLTARKTAGCDLCRTNQVCNLGRRLRRPRNGRRLRRRGSAMKANLGRVFQHSRAAAFQIDLEAGRPATLATHQKCNSTDRWRRPSWQCIRASLQLPTGSFPADPFHARPYLACLPRVARMLKSQLLDYFADLLPSAAFELLQDHDQPTCREPDQRKAHSWHCPCPLVRFRGRRFNDFHAQRGLSSSRNAFLDQSSSNGARPDSRDLHSSFLRAESWCCGRSSCRLGGDAKLFGIHDRADLEGARVADRPAFCDCLVFVDLLLGTGFGRTDTGTGSLRAHYSVCFYGSLLRRPSASICISSIPTTRPTDLWGRS